MARWDDGVESWECARWRAESLLFLTLDVTRALAADFDLPAEELDALRSELRRAAEPLLADIAAGYPLVLDEEVESLLGETALGLVQRFYDHVLRYYHSRDLYSTWGDLLIQCYHEDALWNGLGLPEGDSQLLRQAFWTSRDGMAVDDRIAALVQGELSDWDRRVAADRAFRDLDDGRGILYDLLFSCLAGTVREQRFWREAAARLGDAGLRQLHAAAEALVEREDRVHFCKPLHDPWLLVHPDLNALVPLPKEKPWAESLHLLRAFLPPNR